MRVPLFTCLAIIMFAQPATAGWQATRWGSGPAEVAKAMSLKFPAGDPHPASPADGSTYAVSPYSAGQFKFSAAFRFTALRLDQVHLTLLESGIASCSALSASLGARYGKPAETDKSMPNRRVWLDPQHNNRVELKIYTDAFCTVDYDPLRTAATTAL